MTLPAQTHPPPGVIATSLAKQPAAFSQVVGIKLVKAEAALDDLDGIFDAEGSGELAVNLMGSPGLVTSSYSSLSSGQQDLVRRTGKVEGSENLVLLRERHTLPPPPRY